MRAWMRTLGICWLGFLVWVVGCTAPPSTAKPSAAGSKQQQARGSKDAAANPDDQGEPEVLPQTHMAAGRLHESQNKLARAAEQYQLAIAAQPKYIDAYNRLGIVLDRLGRFKEADDAFRWDPLESTCRHASLSIL